MQTYSPKSNTVGFWDVFTEKTCLTSLSVKRLRLLTNSSQFEGVTGDCEVALHILIGQCTVYVQGSWGAQTYRSLGERTDVFSGLPTTVVVPPSSTYTIQPHTVLDMVVASTPAVNRISIPTVVRPCDIAVHDIGEGHTRRTVREVLGGNGPAHKLRVGETINPVGQWSSWPHHGFDANPELAKDFEEVFLYFTKPRTGWGLQVRHGLFSNGEPVNDVLTVHSGDAAIVPLGDHPVIAGVDSQLLYVWFYISPIPKIYAQWAEDLGGYA